MLKQLFFCAIQVHSQLGECSDSYLFQRFEQAKDQSLCFHSSGLPALVPCRPVLLEAAAPRMTHWGSSQSPPHHTAGTLQQTLCLGLSKKEAKTLHITGYVHG